jgi:predicted TIM-barrel fold metal-dependent hydrolase
VPGRVYFSTFGDPVAFRILDLVGPDQLMFETDYPHNDTNWPRSMEAANKATEGLDEETKRKVLSTNAKRFFGLV